MSLTLPPFRKPSLFKSVNDRKEPLKNFPQTNAGRSEPAVLSGKFPKAFFFSSPHWSQNPNPSLGAGEDLGLVEFPVATPAPFFAAAAPKDIDGSPQHGLSA